MINNIIKKIAKEKTGKELPIINASLGERKEYLAKQNAKRVAQDVHKIQKEKADRYYINSVWPNNQPIIFSFKNWKIEKQKKSEQARNVARQAYALTMELEKKYFNIILTGPVGTGKTALAVAMIEFLKNRNKTVMFVSTNEMARMFVSMYDPIDGREVKRRLKLLVKAMSTVDILVLDDFGTEGGMRGSIRSVRKDMQDSIYDIANARYENQKATIITTNNTLGELQSMYSSKILSRLIPTSHNHNIDFSELDDVRASVL